MCSKIIISLIALLVSSCSRQLQHVDVVKPTGYESTVSRNVIVFLNDKYAERNELQNTCTMAFAEINPINLKCYFVKNANEALPDVGNVIAVFAFGSEKLTLLRSKYESAIKVIISNKKVSGNDVIWIRKHNLVANIGFAQQAISTNHKRAIWLDYNEKNNKIFDEAIYRKNGNNDLTVDHISLDNEKFNKMEILSTDAIFTNTSVKDFFKLSNIKYKNVIFTDIFSLKINELNSPNGIFFFFRNYDFFENFSYMYNQNFGTYPSIASAMLFDFLSVLLSSNKIPSKERIKANMSTLNDNKDSLYHKGEGSNVELYSY